MLSLDTTFSNNSINSNGVVHWDTDETTPNFVMSQNSNTQVTHTARQRSTKLRKESKCAIPEKNINKENLDKRHSSRENRKIQENKLNELLKENWHLKNELLTLKRMFGVSEDLDVTPGRRTSDVSGNVHPDL